MANFGPRSGPDLASLCLEAEPRSLRIPLLKRGICTGSEPRLGPNLTQIGPDGAQIWPKWPILVIFEVFAAFSFSLKSAKTVKYRRSICVHMAISIYQYVHFKRYLSI